MSGPQKVYVIGPNKRKPRVDIDMPSVDGKSGGGSGSDGTSSSTGESPRHTDRRPGWPLLLLCCTGPFAILATSRGRRNRLWSASAFLSIVLGAIAAWLWEPVVTGSAGGSRSAVALLITACVALVAGFAAWARGIFLIGRQEGARIRRIPDILKRPAGAGFLGAVMPGLGLLISGRSRQAAAALWMVCVTLISMLILSQADWLWRFDRKAGALAAGGRALEYFFIFLTVCGLLGVVSWIAQAIDGMRHSAKGNGQVAASRAGLLIVVSVAVFAVWTIAFEGGPMAKMLDLNAASLHEEGFEIVPLVMSEAAMTLDSSRPAYTAHAIAMYESAGRYDRALVLRRSLVDRLEPCIGVLEEEGLVTRALANRRSEIEDAGDVPAQADRVLPAELTIFSGTPSPFMP